MANQNKMQVAIIGAGPAGLFAAQALANRGFGVALFNRDIKPGGLAEYGIYPDKYRIKEGLRAQFKLILENENIHYIGNVTVGKNGRFGIEDLKEWGFSAVLVTCGAQGTKSLRLPGETLKRVYHAKDLVFHYNHLPSHSQLDFSMGKKVAIVGAGNVMADVVHYLISYRDVDEITVIVRRGPAEVKFSHKEMLAWIAYLDQDDFAAEIARVAPYMEAIGQNPQEAADNILSTLENACPKEHDTVFRLRFLYSPKEVIGGEDGSVAGMIVEQNTLELRDGAVACKGLGKTTRLDLDSVIFAIGDRINDDLDLPMNGTEINKAAEPKYPVNGISFEIADMDTGQAIPGLFHAGWSRNASTGLVGIARKDGVDASEAIVQYLEANQAGEGVSADEIEAQLKSRGIVFVTKEKLPLLEAKEKEQAEIHGTKEYKFDTDSEMLRAMNLL